MLPEHVAADPDLKQRFEREAKTISSLNHPPICTLYDIGEQDGIDFLVMEYLEGDTLAQRLEKGAYQLPALDIGVLTMDGEESWQPLFQTDSSESSPAISPNGEWIAFVSDRTGQSEIYVKRFVAQMYAS